MTSDQLSVKFWGVRGSIPCPGPATVRYGGNTPCLEVHAAGRLMFFDAGTGLLPLGNALAAAGAPVDADWYFTHTHFDHIQGLPFFSPLYDKRNTLRLWASHLAPEMTLKEVLSKMMQAPLFPIPIEIFGADVKFNDFARMSTLEPAPGVRVRTTMLNHPNRATGYRVEVAGKSLCYVTDTEHVPGKPDENILGLIAGADLVIYDSTYTDDEFPAHVGWGHSTWQEGVRLADRAGAKRLVIFHHDPSHDDAFMDRVAAAASAVRPGTIVAREGETITL
ncbi:MAG: MBL fold metallo-hydrolase [Alphaproteobacteria bacterium]|nr:MBL fold metallo-hydrolase [Alphaproteobacteria bacterium]